MFIGFKLERIRYDFLARALSFDWHSRRGLSFHSKNCCAIRADYFLSLYTNIKLSNELHTSVATFFTYKLAISATIKSFSSSIGHIYDMAFLHNTSYSYPNLTILSQNCQLKKQLI